MKLSNAKTPRTKVGDSYLALIRLHPLRALKSQNEYEAASAVLDKLALREDLDIGEEEYLETLEVLITAYDDRHAADQADNRSPLERLKSLMELSGTTAVGLREILGSSQSMVSMLLNGQRDLSKKAIAKLAEHYKVEPGYFL